MRFFYGNKNPLRVLDEMEFWKRQEAEHTVIRSGGNISPQLNEAILCLIEYAMKESECFIGISQTILYESNCR